jgi:hypothetical protein
MATALVPAALAERYVALTYHTDRAAFVALDPERQRP